MCIRDRLILVQCYWEDIQKEMERMWPRPTINIIEIELIHCEKFPGVIGTSTVAKEMIDY